MGLTVTSLRTEIVNLWEKNLSYRQIARTLRCSRSAVSVYVHLHRKEEGRYVDPNPVEVRDYSRGALRSEIVRLWKLGYTYTQIAVALHCSRSTVAGHIYRHRAGMGSGVVRTKRPAAPRKDRRDCKRTRGPNRATDPATYEVVEAIAGSKLYDVEIADRAGITLNTLRAWRSGTHKGQSFLLECVREAITRSE